jgi:hypothetical protein
MKKLNAVFVLGCAAVAGCSDGGPLPGEEPVGEAQQALVKYCKYLDPAVVAPLPVPVDFTRELVIRDLPVVEDPCRTTWTLGGPCIGSRGVWTFAALMTQMAGTVPPQQFVADWLHQWEVGVVVGPRFVPARPGIRGAILDKWLVASGCAAGAPIVGGGACALDLKKAPFRLLAIVNRVDMSTWTTGAPPTRDPEARMVFGAFDLTTGNPLQATVIFEYKLPTQRGGVPYSTVNWANAWHALSNGALGPIGSTAYLGVLTPIVQDIAFAGAQPGNPNLGSSLGQVRTNEIAFGGAPWKLREFHLTNTGAGVNAERLRMSSTKQTPDDTFNVSAALDGFLDPNSISMGSTALVDFTYSVPGGLLGAESSAPMLWNHSGASPLVPLERTQFGFGTCNGCHTLETNTVFTHIAPRAAGAVAALSPFLSTGTATVAGNPVATFTVADPAPTGATFKYNEPWRRVCETTAILDGAPGPVTNGNGG